MKRIGLSIVLTLAACSLGLAQVNIVYPSNGAMRFRQGPLVTKLHYNSGSRWNRFFDSVDVNGPGRRALIGDLGGQIIEQLPDIIPLPTNQASSGPTETVTKDVEVMSNADATLAAATISEIRAATELRRQRLNSLDVSSCQLLQRVGFEEWKDSSDEWFYCPTGPGVANPSGGSNSEGTVSPDHPSVPPTVGGSAKGGSQSGGFQIDSNSPGVAPKNDGSANGGAVGNGAVGNGSSPSVGGGGGGAFIPPVQDGAGPSGQ